MFHKWPVLTEGSFCGIKWELHVRMNPAQRCLNATVWNKLRFSWSSKKKKCLQGTTKHDFKNNNWHFPWRSQCIHSHTQNQTNWFLRFCSGNLKSEVTLIWSEWNPSAVRKVWFSCVQYEKISRFSEMSPLPPRLSYLNWLSSWLLVFAAPTPSALFSSTIQTTRASIQQVGPRLSLQTLQLMVLQILFPWLPIYNLDRF